MVKVIYTAGTFDLFHVGHVNLLMESKKLGDLLIVGVSSDELVLSYKKHLPVIPYIQRAQVVKACKYVDVVIPQTKLLDLDEIKLIDPDLVVIGSDWINSTLPIFEYLKNQDKLVFVKYTTGVSTTSIRENFKKITNN